jgi:hypothetical protein
MEIIELIVVKPVADAMMRFRQNDSPCVVELHSVELKDWISSLGKCPPVESRTSRSSVL